MAVIPAARLGRPRRWPGVVAWTLWALAVVAAPAIVWLDHLLRQAGRPDLVQWDARPAVGLVSAVTVGAVLASRRPRHPVGWLLLVQAVSLIATGAAAQYLAWGLLAGPRTLPATRYATDGSFPDRSQGFVKQAVRGVHPVCAAPEPAPDVKMTSSATDPTGISARCRPS